MMLQPSQNTIYQVTPYYPPHLGGMQNCVKKISELLSGMGHRVQVLASNIGTDKKSYTDNNLSVSYLKSIEIANTPISLLLISQLLKIDSKSLVHVHIANAFFPETVYLISLIKKYTYIAHFHLDVPASGFSGIILPVYKKLVLKKVLKHADHIICLTEAQKKFLISTYTVKPDMITIVPNGVDEHFFSDHETRSQEPYNILFLGRLSRQKNIFTLLDSIKLVKHKVTLMMVGEGMLRADVEEYLKNKNINNVELVGHKNETELPFYFNKADLFVLPSHIEGMSLAALEAMASGVPVVVNDSEEMRELLGNSAFFVKTNSAESYAQMIDYALDAIEIREQNSIKNREVAKTYSWNNVVDRLESIYNNIR